ncbi:fucose isomerase [Gammaproteobacteria bacterium]|nr:fucose isomerase [Gammaproteobacteria bacterium]
MSESSLSKKALIPKVAVLPLARSTFDVEYAQTILNDAWELLSSLNIELIAPLSSDGKPELQFDADSANAVLPNLLAANPDVLLLLQVTFTDASMTVEIANKIKMPLALWSFPEPRTGGRLRLNSFCGVNLAKHALSRQTLEAQTLHGLPCDVKAELEQLLQACAIANRLKSTKIGVVGDHPDGFDACNYNEQQLKDHFGISIEKTDVTSFINQVKAMPDSAADAPYARRARDFSNLAEMDQVATRKTCKVYSGLSENAQKSNFQGIAVRCWPDFFVEYGCAACGAISMLNEDGIPGGCEADVFGVISSLILQWSANQAAFNTDLVDIDPQDDSVVFWHCGQAPIEMADRTGPVRATIHSNRKLPLLSEFALKPGRFTLCRISQGQGKLRMILGAGEMLQRPLAFSGTAGVARMDIKADAFMARLLDQGLEHHSALVYGEHRPLLRTLARILKLEIVELT